MDEKAFVPSRASSLDPEAIQRRLETQVFGIADKLVYLPVVDSTNTRAMQLALAGAKEGTVVLADTQTAGKGRMGRPWFDIPEDDILLSIVLHPLFPAHYIVEFASLAVVQAIQATCQLAAEIKWPNDVLIDNRKVSGMIIETSRTADGQIIAIPGIGVNANGTMQQWLDTHQDQAPLLAAATTLETVRRHVNREIFIAHLLKGLEADYLALQQEARAGSISSTSSARSDQSASHRIWERWRSQLSTLGRTVEVNQGERIVSGIAEDVNTDGELLLRRDSGELTVITLGDVGYPTP